MHSSRIVIRTPQVCRLVKAPAVTRSMSLFPSSQFFPRGFPAAAFGNELAPLFRLMDDITSSPASPLRAFDYFALQQQQQQRPFTPRFDVREVGDAYELRGELPGVQIKDLDVEFTDAHTLVIRGRTESESTTTNVANTTTTTTTSSEPAAVEANATATSTTADATPATTADANSDAASSVSSTSYQKATVEDEDGVLVNANDEPVAPSITTNAQAEPAKQQHQQQEVATAPASAPAAPTPTPRYWLSERSTGSFQRAFSFPARVDRGRVSAKLADGVLSVTVPKATVEGARRIAVE